MGQIAATNIVTLMIQNFHRGMNLHLVKCPSFQPMMSLTVGDNVVAYRPRSEVRSGGVELKEMLVGRGLGIDGKLIFLSK
jgi:hypothetical protein